MQFSIIRNVRFDDKLLGNHAAVFEKDLSTRTCETRNKKIV